MCSFLTSGGRLVAQLLSLLSGYSLIEISNDITMYLSLISIGMLLLKKETLQDRLFKTTVKDISNKNILIKTIFRRILWIVLWIRLVMRLHQLHKK